jgi:integrase
MPTVRRLIGKRHEGYVLADLKPNKFGDRSNAIGKRFGRLKTAAGFGNSHVFHSIRKTVVTLLENGGVSENVAADIVGHEKPRITYGLYSEGATLEVKRAALAKLQYPKQL